MKKQNRKNIRPTEQELLAVWDAMVKVNPYEPVQAAQGYGKVLSALKWCIENDDVNTWDPMNTYWINGWLRARRAYKAAKGKDPMPDHADTLKGCFKEYSQ